MSQSKKEALDYLNEFGDEFWNNTITNIKEVIRKTEEELKGSFNGKISDPKKIGLIEAGAGGSKHLTEEEKVEIKNIGQKIVNDDQLNKLTRLLEALDKDILIDPQKKYFLTIDKLDENWISDEYRYDLIAALLDSANTINNTVYNAKIIIAIREDLVNRVFRVIKKSGYQEEKYESRKLIIRWTEEDLVKIVDERVQLLIREQYTSQNVHLADILPAQIGKSKEAPIKYILDRTWLRPRDIIMFVNECIKNAIGKTQISQDDLKRAEEQYSSRRLEALRDEWVTDYPNLPELIRCIKKFPKSFQYAEIKSIFEDNILKFLAESKGKVNSIALTNLEELFNRNENESVFQEFIAVLHQVGAIGIKAESFNKTYWTHLGDNVGEFEIESTFYIHPALWRVLGINPHN